MKKYLTYYIAVLFAIAFVACGSEIPLPPNGPDPIEPVNSKALSGHIQKGPFASGGLIYIFPIDQNLSPGTKNIPLYTDASGWYEGKEMDLTDRVQVQATGQYFNEVTNSVTGGFITLYALVDIAESESANVNVLTHLERERIQHLVRNEGYSFINARKQAQKDVLNIFSLQMPVDVRSDALDISAAGDENAILLAVSCILQGNGNNATSIEQLMNDIIADFRTDGKLDSLELGSQLVSSARSLSAETISENLTTYYAGLGKTINAPNAGKYIQQFLEKTSFVEMILYPATGANGPNLLHESVTTLEVKGYSIKAVVPSSKTLKIRITTSRPFWGWGINVVNWERTAFSNESGKYYMDFQVIEPGKESDMHFSQIEMDADGGIAKVTGKPPVSNKGEIITIEFFEDDSETPTHTKEITVTVSGTFLSFTG